VYLSWEDLKKLAVRTNMDNESFFKTYCRWVTDYNGDEVVSLKEKKNNDCIFWDQGCTVYDSRPLQCVSFPFWESVVASKEAWEIASSGCPGINSGLLHNVDEITHLLRSRQEMPIIKRQGAN
jgi:Fe-S-cluster containining protein